VDRDKQSLSIQVCFVFVRNIPYRKFVKNAALFQRAPLAQIKIKTILMAANGSKCSPSIFSCNSSLKAKAKDNEYRFQHYRFIYKILDTYYNTRIKKHETSLEI